MTTEDLTTEDLAWGETWVTAGKEAEALTALANQAADTAAATGADPQEQAHAAFLAVLAATGDEDLAQDAADEVALARDPDLADEA